MTQLTVQNFGNVCSLAGTLMVCAQGIIPTHTTYQLNFPAVNSITEHVKNITGGGPIVGSVLMVMGLQYSPIVSIVPTVLNTGTFGC